MVMASNADAPAATGSVSFKAYYTPNGGDKPQEVRRFGMEQTEVTSFDLLKKKIREVFPSLTKVEFTVGWKDFDNDDIIISSDEELLTALTESTGQVHRLYLVSKYTSPPPTFHSPLGWKQFNAVVTGCPAVDPVDVIDSDEEDDDMILTPPGCKRSWQSISQSACKKVHPRIYCDGCNKNIDSHRYKCLECDDFDLCHHCESQLMHEEHIMIRIPLTKNYYTKLNNFTKSMRSMSDTLHKIDNRCKKQERRIQKVREMNKRCDDTFGVAEEMLHCSKRCKRDGKVKEKKEKRDKKEKGQPRIHSSFSQVPAGSNGSANDNTSSQSKASTSKDPTGQSSGGDCPFPTGFLKSLFDHQVIGSLMNPQNFMTLQNFLQQLSPVPDHVLQEIAKNLADVTLSNPDTPSASSTPVGNPFSMNKEGAASVDTDSAPQPTFSAPPATGKPEDSQVSVQAISVAPSDLAAPSLAATTDNSHVPESPHNQQLCFSSSSEEADVEEWTVVDDQAKEERSNHASVYPKLPESESIPELNIPAPVLHQDPAVRKCLQSLADMGYQAQDHLIVELAEEFKGNLDHVLNVLLT